MAISSSRRKAIHALGDAASVLRGSENVPIPQKIRNVAHELFKGKRVKSVANEGVELPEQAVEIFEEILNLLFLLNESASELIQDKSFTIETVRNFEVLKHFADNVFLFYHSETSPLALKVKGALLHAIADGLAAMSLSNLRDEIHTLVENYHNTLEVSPEQFKMNLEMIASKIDEVSVQAFSVEESPILCAQIISLKTLVESAKRLYEIPEPPGITGKNAVNLLRIASEMIQSANTYFEIQKVLEIVHEAEKHLSGGGRKFQLEGEIHILAIKEKIHLYLRKQIPELRRDLSIPFIFIPTDKMRSEQIYETVSRKKIRLMEYYELAKHWTGEHEYDISELMREIKESLDSRVGNLIGELRKHDQEELADKFQNLLK